MNSQWVAQQAGEKGNHNSYRKREEEGERKERTAKESMKDTERKNPQEESVRIVKVAGKNVMDILMKFRERKHLQEEERNLKKESEMMQNKRGRKKKIGRGMLRGEQTIDKFMLKERKSC